jgi:menaquinone-dependent protoporphyrinogen oxidase
MPSAVSCGTPPTGLLVVIALGKLDGPSVVSSAANLVNLLREAPVQWYDDHTTWTKAVGTMRVVVLHGSTHGGTAGLGRMIAEAFTRRDISADVGSAADVDDLSGYDAVVVGGALYFDRWHHDAREFVRRNEQTLRGMPVWFFSSGPLDDSARGGAIAPVAQVLRLARAVEIRGHMTFGGCLDRATIGFRDAVWAHGRKGDYRDADQVAEWVYRIAAALAPAAPAAVISGAVPRPRRSSRSTAGSRR